MRQGCNNYNQQHKELLKVKTKQVIQVENRLRLYINKWRRLNGNKHTLQPWNFTN